MAVSCVQTHSGVYDLYQPVIKHLGKMLLNRVHEPFIETMYKCFSISTFSCFLTLTKTRLSNFFKSF